MMHHRISEYLYLIYVNSGVRMANSEAVAHTPQPHIGEAYVGIKRSISAMYRGAVPITEHQLADGLERLYQKVRISRDAA